MAAVYLTDSTTITTEDNWRVEYSSNLHARQNLYIYRDYIKNIYREEYIPTYTNIYKEYIWYIDYTIYRLHLATAFSRALAATIATLSLFTYLRNFPASHSDGH